MKMKQEMRPTLKQKQVLTMKQQQDLKILSFSSSELQTYIEEQVEAIPYWNRISNMKPAISKSVSAILNL